MSRHELSQTYVNENHISGESQSKGPEMFWGMSYVSNERKLGILELERLTSPQNRHQE